MIKLISIVLVSTFMGYCESTQTKVDNYCQMDYEEPGKELTIPTDEIGYLSERDSKIDNYHLDGMHNNYGNRYIDLLGYVKYQYSFSDSKIRFIDRWVQEINKATRVLRKLCRVISNSKASHNINIVCKDFGNLMVSDNTIIGYPVSGRAMADIYNLQSKTECKTTNLECVHIDLVVELMETINENTIVIFEKLDKLSEMYRALINNQFFDRIFTLRNLATNHTALAHMVTENEVLQDVIDNRLEIIKNRRITLEQNQRIMEYSGMWSSITAPIVSIFPSLSRTLGFTVHEAIDGLNLPDIGDSVGQTVGGLGSGLVGGLSRGLGIGWRLIIIIGVLLILSYIMNIFKIITDISTKFFSKK